MSRIDETETRARKLERDVQATQAAAREAAGERERLQRALAESRREFERREQQLHQRIASAELQHEALSGELDTARGQIANQHEALEKQRKETRQQLEETRRTFEADQARISSDLRDMEARHAKAISALQAEIEREAARQRCLAEDRAGRASCLCTLAEHLLAPWRDVVEGLDLATQRNHIRRQASSAHELAAQADAESALAIATLALDAARAFSDEVLARQARMENWRAQLLARSVLASEPLHSEATVRYCRLETDSATLDMEQLRDEIAESFRDYRWAATAFYHLERRTEAAAEVAARISAQAQERSAADIARRENVKKTCDVFRRTLDDAAHFTARLVVEKDASSDILLLACITGQTLRLRFPLQGGIVLENSGAASTLNAVRDRLALSFSRETIRSDTTNTPL